MSSFYAYLGRMKYIERWSLMRNTTKENILEHSAQVAHLAHGIATVANKYFGMDLSADKITTLALFHETSEVITGDLPTPIKYHNNRITEAYKSIETLANDKLVSTLPTKMQPVYREITGSNSDSVEKKIVKYADRLAAYIKCVEELSSGNSEFKNAESSVKAKLDKDSENFPPLKYFIDNFVEKKKKTLDDLTL